MSQPGYILVSSRIHHRSVVRYRPDRVRDHTFADPTSKGWRDASGTEEVVAGVGPAEGSRPPVFAFSVSEAVPGGAVGALPRLQGLPCQEAGSALAPVVGDREGQRNVGAAAVEDQRHDGEDEGQCEQELVGEVDVARLEGELGRLQESEQQ